MATAPKAMTASSMRPAVQAVRDRERLAGDVHAELEHDGAGRERQQHAGEHGEAAGERHGRVMDFALAGVVHEVDAQTPFAPERQRQQRGQKRAGKSGQEKVEGKVMVRIFYWT